MTGPGPGKIPLDAVVELVIGSSTLRIDAEVYLHVKGWSRAFVTHIDVESPQMNELVARPKQGFYARAVYRPIGLVIDAARAIKPCLIRLREKTLLPKVFPLGTETWCFVGGKYGGIFSGFRKEFVSKMESLAKELWGVEPLRKR